MLHEKIDILTSNLSRGESEHEKIKEEVKEYKRNNHKLLRDLEINKKYKDESIKLARDVINLDKELLREKNLNKALIEEVESSEKLFHRWRKLEGIDPDALEMHYKINLLQKRLIAKTEECVEKEITIQDITKEAANLKRIVNKKPTLEIEEAIRIYKQMLQENSVKMKSIIAERNYYETQVEELKDEVRRDKKDITEYQMKLAEMKNRVNKISEEFKKVKENRMNVLPN
jgi:hypothetical protein